MTTPHKPLPSCPTYDALRAHVGDPKGGDPTIAEHLRVCDGCDELAALWCDGGEVEASEDPGGMWGSATVVVEWRTVVDRTARSGVVPLDTRVQTAVHELAGGLSADSDGFHGRAAFSAGSGHLGEAGVPLEPARCKEILAALVPLLAPGQPLDGRVVTMSAQRGTRVLAQLGYPPGPGKPGSSADLGPGLWLSEEIAPVVVGTSPGVSAVAGWRRHSPNNPTDREPAGAERALLSRPAEPIGRVASSTRQRPRRGIWTGLTLVAALAAVTVWLVPLHRDAPDSALLPVMDLAVSAYRGKSDAPVRPGDPLGVSARVPVDSWVCVFVLSAQGISYEGGVPPPHPGYAQETPPEGQGRALGDIQIDLVAPDLSGGFQVIVLALDREVPEAVLDQTAAHATSRLRDAGLLCTSSSCEQERASVAPKLLSEHLARAGGQPAWGAATSQTFHNLGQAPGGRLR